MNHKDDAIRAFDTGATRSSDAGRPDYEGYLSPLVIERFGEYMTKHRKQADGTLRESDNWQKGMPLATYVKALWRHMHHFWMRHRGWVVVDPKAAETIQDDLCAMLFNTQGYLHALLAEQQSAKAVTWYGVQTPWKLPTSAVVLTVDSIKDAIHTLHYANYRVGPTDRRTRNRPGSSGVLFFSPYMNRDWCRAGRRQGDVHYRGLPTDKRQGPADRRVLGTLKETTARLFASTRHGAAERMILWAGPSGQHVRGRRSTDLPYIREYRDGTKQ